VTAAPPPAAAGCVLVEVAGAALLVVALLDLDELDDDELELEPQPATPAPNATAAAITATRGTKPLLQTNCMPLFFPHVLARNPELAAGDGLVVQGPSAGCRTRRPVDPLV
jgi:hypothetical protein